MQSLNQPIYRPPSSIYRPPSSIYRPPSSIYRPPSSIYRPPSSIYRPHICAVWKRSKKQTKSLNFIFALSKSQTRYAKIH